MGEKGVGTRKGEEEKGVGTREREEEADANDISAE